MPEHCLKQEALASYSARCGSKKVGTKPWRRPVVCRLGMNLAPHKP
jgi:hypothetical protein